MKVILSCKVDSLAVLDQPFKLSINNKEVAFGIGDKGIWNSITVTAKVTDPSKVKWGLEPVVPLTPEHAPQNVNAEVGKELYHEIISDIQSLESTLALFFPLRHIRWANNTLNVQWEEGDPPNPPDWGPLFNVNVGRAERKPVPVTINEFQSFALLSTTYRSINVAQSFWREGSNEFERGNFINAFYNFYFVLEGLYANGKWRTGQVLAEFKNNTELCESVNLFLKESHPEMHIRQVAAMLITKHKKPDVEGFLFLVVHTRGELHHVADSPHKIQPSPFVQDEFEGLADVVRFLSRRALLNAMMRITERDNARRRKRTL